MKELSKKVFITIFSILSLFIFITLFVYNYQSYNREYESIKRNTNIINDRKEKRPSEELPKDYKEMRIIDYEVYTVELENKNIKTINSHGNESNDFDIENIAKTIIKGEITTEKIGNLYLSDYAYKYQNNNTLVIINTKTIKNRLRKLLVKTIIIYIILELIILYLTRIITSWLIKPAEEALKKQRDFIADASHELKTPLAIIMASSDELKTDNNNKKYIDNIKYESERMNNLINNMLDLSKIENGITKQTYKEENISKIIEKITLTFEGIAYEEKISIKTNIEENLIIKCNKEEIEKLCSIIVDNAIKHSYKDTTIEVNVYKEKNNILIKITNIGEPINKGDEEKIFERFYRGDKSRNRKENRYGLGLAIAKNIVINHNGEISAKSKNNQTTFKIILKK